MFALQPLLRAGVFEPGPRLTCSVSGVVYTAHLGVNGEIRCLCGCAETFRSPSAYSVHIKRKINAKRKADDGWTSTKYMGVPLGAYRSQLEELLTTDKTSNNSNSSGTASSETAVLLSQVVKQKRKGRAPRSTIKSGHPSRNEKNDEVDNAKQPVPSAEPLQAQGDRQHFTKQQACRMQSPVRAVRELPLSFKNIGALWRSSGAVEADLQYTWVQCSDPACRKWRQVKYTSNSVCDNWVCSNGTAEGHQPSDCSPPQQLPDLQVQWLLQDEAAKRFAAASSRPSLEVCDEQQFEADLLGFFTAKGDEQLAALVRDKKITCNNSPLDLFGLYREVVRQGGLVDNERYDERGRWSGGINFAGDVFPRLKNFTANNRATSVGNQLLNNYKKFLLAYEKAYRSRDIKTTAAGLATDAAATSAGAAAPAGLLVPAAAGADVVAGSTDALSRHHTAVAAASDSDWESDVHEDDDVDVNAGAGQASNPLVMLATAALVPTPGPQQQQQQQHQRVTVTRDFTADLSARLSKRPRLSPAAATTSTSTPVVPEAHDLQQQQEQVYHHADGCIQCSIAGSAAYVRQLQAAAAHAVSAHDRTAVKSWCAPGSLVLVSDSEQQQQQQHTDQVSAAVVADISQLPLSLAQPATAAAAAACSNQGSLLPHVDSLPSTTNSHSSSIRGVLGSCLPVLMLGSRRLCWVPVSSCKPLTPADAQAALAAAWSNAPRNIIDRTSSSSSSSSGQLTSQHSSNMVYCCDHSQGCRYAHSAAAGQEKQQQHQPTTGHWSERVRGLKQALQWATCSSSSPSSTSNAPRRCVTAVGCAAVAADLLELEGQLPPVGVSSSSGAFWDVWRADVQSAATPEQLAHQVLMLVYQLNSQLLLPGVDDDLWSELQQLLGITQHKPTAAAADAQDTDAQGYYSEHNHPQHSSHHQPQQQQQQQQGQHDQSSNAVSQAPSVLSVSEAVRVVTLAVDWGRARQLWQTGTVGYCCQQQHPAAATGGGGGRRTDVLTGGGGAITAADVQLVQQLPAAAPLLLPLFQQQHQQQQSTGSCRSEPQQQQQLVAMGAGCDVQQLVSLLLCAAPALTSPGTSAPPVNSLAVNSADLSPQLSAAETLDQTEAATAVMQTHGTDSVPSAAAAAVNASGQCLQKHNQTDTAAAPMVVQTSTLKVSADPWMQSAFGTAAAAIPCAAANPSAAVNVVSIHCLSGDSFTSSDEVLPQHMQQLVAHGSSSGRGEAAVEG